MIAPAAPAQRAGAGHSGRVAIVGGGMLGAVLALRLQQAGSQVAIFESAPHLGGLAAPWQLGPVIWDRHYHVILESDRTLRALLAELDLEAEVAWTSVRTGFYTRGAFHDMSSVRDFLAFPPLGIGDKLRLGAAILYASRADPRRLKATTAAAWLTRLCGKRVYEEMWEPLLRAKLGANAPHVAASFIAATIARMYGARSSANGAERFGVVPGGYARILNALGARLTALGVDVRCSTPVEQIARAGDGIAVRTNGVDEPFDRAVVTVPAPVIPRLLPSLADGERAALAAVPYAGVVCASLLLNEPLGPYYITNITERWVPFSAVIEFSNVAGRAGFSGASLVYLPKYVAPDDPLFAEDEATIRASFVGAIARMYPAFDAAALRAFRLSRVRHVFPFPVAAAPAEPLPLATSIPGVTIATAAQIEDATLNVDRTVALAERAAAHVLAERAA